MCLLRIGLDGAVEGLPVPTYYLATGIDDNVIFLLDHLRIIRITLVNTDTVPLSVIPSVTYTFVGGFFERFEMGRNLVPCLPAEPASILPAVFSALMVLIRSSAAMTSFPA